jgi:acetyltransferase EpsM
LNDCVPTVRPPDRPTVQPLILIGASGFGREVLWVCRRAGLEVAGFCDDAAEKQTGAFAGVPLLGNIGQAAARLGAGISFHIAVGDNRARQRLAEHAQAVGWKAVAVIDPSASVAPDAVAEPGAYVGIGSVVSCMSHVARFAIVNHHVTVGHDVAVGAYAQLCPGVRVSGGCVLGEGSLLGSNAAILPGKRMGNWSVLGAGSVAMADIGDHAHVVRVR